MHHDSKRLAFLNSQYRKACELVIATNQEKIEVLSHLVGWPGGECATAATKRYEATIRKYKRELTRC